MKRLLLIAWIGLLLAPPAAARAKPAKQTKLALSSGIYFATGTATLEDSSRPALDEAAKFLKGNKKVILRIEVHTDSRGSSSYNRKISQQRADAIARALVKRGVKAKRLDPKGYGEDHPIADNKTEAGRAKNRRIELVAVDR